MFSQLGPVILEMIERVYDNETRVKSYIPSIYPLLQIAIATYSSSR